MSDVLAAVYDHMTGPFVWGVSDCCTSACDVFQALHGIDPMAPLRGRYASQDQAHDLIRARGGWRRMASGLARAAGLCPCAVTVCGAIGLVKQPGGFVLGIGLGRGWWAGRVDGGFVTTQGAVLAWQKQ